MITVVRVLLLMADFLFLYFISVVRVQVVCGRPYLCKDLPLVFDFCRLLSPLLTDYFGDLRVCESRMLGCDCRLIVLAVKDESCVQPMSFV